MTDISIRLVTMDDLDAVTAVEAECFPAAEAATRSSFEQRIRTFPESFFVAVHDTANAVHRLYHGCRYYCVLR